MLTLDEEERNFKNSDDNAVSSSLNISSSLLSSSRKRKRKIDEDFITSGIIYIYILYTRIYTYILNYCCVYNIYIVFQVIKINNSYNNFIIFKFAI